jgi:two-component system, cell cycle response regulator
MSRQALDSETEFALEHLRGTNWDEVSTRDAALPPAPSFSSAVLPVARPMLPSLSPDPVFVEEAERDTDVSASIRAMSMLPEPRKQAALIRMDGVGAGTAVTLGAGTTRMGRDSGCELRIEDSAVSRVHAEIVRLDSTHVLVDLGAQNGVFVNGRQISREALHDGDWIQLGPRVRFRYSVSDDNELKLLQRLYETSSRDALTGAYNRQHFVRLMATELSFAERHHTPLSLMLIDLDHFKQVNDSYGHGAGDVVLKQVTTALTQRLRDGDTLARFGGEEFAVCLRGTDLRTCSRMAERLRATVATVPVVYEGRYIPVTISIGCASLACAPEKNLEKLLAVADRRLYAAKRTGRNRVVAAD